ncbi:MAG: ABC transporter ATP-binding protein [Candidatus Omnitrophota bacterium]|nr:ABC transporter ATP-binding protein [Candidatus Omnitrophota bacterium]
MLKKAKLLEIFFIVIIALAAYLLHLKQEFYLVHILSLAGIYVLLALGLNMVIGYTGLLDLGFIAFYAIGAYSAALLSSKGFSFWAILPISILITCAFRFLLGKPLMRLRGDYLAIVTLGFGEITRLILNNWDALTNGPKGLPRVGETIRPITLFSFHLNSEISYFYLILFFVAASIFAIRRIERSKIGRAFVAIREDEIAAEAMGINTSYIKLLSFTISAVFAALAGVIYAHWIGFVSPESFSFWESVFLVCMVVLGGMGNILGIIFGVILLVGLPEFLRITLGGEFVLYRMLLFGLLMVIMTILRPQGIIPEKRRALELKD